MTLLCAGMGEPDFVNLIRNGSFIGNADGWERSTFGDGTPTYESSPSRSVGSGALRSFGEVVYRPGGVQTLPLNGLTTLDVEGYAITDSGTDEATIRLRFYDAVSGASDHLLGTTDVTELGVGTGAWVAVAQTSVAVPVGATHVAITVLGATANLLWTDLYVGTVGDANPPYPGAIVPPLAANRILNGEFEVNLDGWDDINDEETITRDTTAPITGTASLKVVTAEYAGSGVSYGPLNHTDQWGIVVRSGEPLRFSFNVKADRADADLIAWFDWQGASVGDSVWQAIVGTSPQGESVDFTVPTGAYRLNAIWFVTNWNEDDQGVMTFWLDDVELGTPPA